MNLNSLKSTSLDFTYVLNSPENYVNDNFTSSEVLLSYYTVNPTNGLQYGIITTNPNAKVTRFYAGIPLTEERNFYRNITGATAIASALCENSNISFTEVFNTLNEAQKKFGNLYLLQYAADVEAITTEINLSVNNSFYLSELNNANDGKFRLTDFNIGKAQSFNNNYTLFNNVGYLLAKANGDLTKDIGEPYNPVDPQNPSGVLNFVVYSQGISQGLNTLKLAWEVLQDTEKVNYAQMTFNISLQYRNTLHKFKQNLTIGSSGSIDFKFSELVNACGDYGFFDKILAFLPMIDPAPIICEITCYIDGVSLIQPLTFQCLYDGSVSIINNLENDDSYNVYRLQGGNESGEDTKSQSDNDDVYKDDTETGDGDSKDFSGGTDSVNGSALLTTSYALTVSQTHSFGSWLWGGSLFGEDGLQLVNNNPIENIVSAKLFPFSVSGTSTKIQLGNVVSTVDGMKLAENVARTFTFNGGNFITIPLESGYNDYMFLNFAPFTSCRLFVPYLGIQELNLNELYYEYVGSDGATHRDFRFKLKYFVDLVTGMCRAVITSASGKNVHVFDGQIGQDVPITGSNRAQVEVGYITGGLHSALELLTGNVFGAIDSVINTATQMYHSSTTGTPTPCNSRFDSQMAYVIVDRPDVPSLPSKFAHQNGRVCNMTLKLSNLQGYTELDNTVDLSGIKCTTTEREEILSILSSGFYI